MGRITTLLVLAFSIGFLSFNLSATENTFQQFYEQQNAAYASYRSALFQTNKKDQPASLKGINNFSKQWDNIVVQFASNPPEIFADDPDWHSTLTKISGIAAQGKKEIEAGELSEAHETLEAIRDQLSSLRSRNKLIFFSDHVNNYHEFMEHLLLAGYSKENIDENAKNSIREQLAVLEYLSEKIVHQAPENHKSDKVYIKLQAGLITSLKNLRKALDNNNAEGISKAISGLKPAYAKLFAKFG